MNKFLTRRNLFWFGFFIVLVLTFMEVRGCKQLNFFIFQLSTHDFWNGVSPYGAQWSRHGLDYFLYTPVFNVLFAPFAYMPSWTGAFVWNLFNYTLFALSIFQLPYIAEDKKVRMLFYLLPILATSQLSFQYNVSVAYIYLFAYSLLERDKWYWAILLIMVSAVTKIYGSVELLMLLFYPRFWRNTFYALGVGLVLLLLPVVKIGFSGLIPWYTDWMSALVSHNDTRTWESFFHIKLLFSQAPGYMVWIQLGSVMALIVGTFVKFRSWGERNFRAGILGVIMGWIILFGNSTEKHTYLIALTGFLVWYQMVENRCRADKFLYWANLVVLVLMPVDILCPPKVMHFFFDTLDFNKWLFLVTWLRVVYSTYFQNNKKCQIQIS